jgi:hypothetical protein
MKTCILFIALIATSVCFAYTLQSKWIRPDTIIVYQDPSLKNHVFDGADYLANFNYNSCVLAMNVNDHVENAPVFIPSDTDFSDLCSVMYDTIFDEFGEVAINTYGIHTTNLGPPGEFESFIITLNDSGLMDWSELSGSYMDINTTLRHELGHSLGLGHNSDPASLMYEWSDGHPPWNNPITFIRNDEINGLRAIYQKPEINVWHYTSVDGMYEFKSGFEVTFEIRAPEMLPIPDNNGTKPAPLALECYLIRYYEDVNGEYTIPVPLNETFMPDYVSIPAIPLLDGSGNPTGVYQIILFTAKEGEYYELRTYVKRSYYTEFIEYRDYKSPYGSVKFKVGTNVNIQHTQNKADAYSLDAVNTFEATCTDAYGNDYPYMASEGIKFYYKEEGSTGGYTEIEAPVSKVTAYTRAWNSGSLKGDYIVKATAFYYEDAESTEVFNWSDSLTIRLLDGFECKITEPKPYDVEAIDFEKYVNIKGLLYHDGSVDMDSIYKNYNVLDLQNNSRSVKTPDYLDSMTCRNYKYHWYSYPLPAPYGTPLKEKETGVKVATFKSIEESTPAENKSLKAVTSDNVTWSEPLRNDTLDPYDNWLFGTKPGLYKAVGAVYDMYPVNFYTRPDSMTYIKPSWKMKLYGDYWYGYNAQLGIPYKEKTIYAPEEHVRLYQWRPFIERPILPTNFSITNEFSTVANFNYDGNGKYQQYIISKPDSVIYKPLEGWITTMSPDTFLVSTAGPAEWERNGGEVPGFYTVTATEYDPLTGCNVIQKKEIQIPPLYITAESDGIGWPVSVWPRGAEYENMDNADKWVTLGHVFNPALGSNSLASFYDSSDDNGTISLTHPGITLTKDHNVEFQFSMGLKKSLVGSTYKFDELLANYSIALEIDGVEEIIKTATSEEWEVYDSMGRWYGNDGNDSVYYSVRFIKPLGSRVGSGSTIKVKLITEGLGGFFETPQYQWVTFDEICIQYTRKVCPAGPSSPSGYCKNVKGNDFVEISFNPPSDPKYVPEGYIVYRNGKKAGETTATTFIDYNIESNKSYRYSITAKYSGYDYPESSILDCVTSVTTGTIVYPRPRNFTLIEGEGEDYNTMFLNWTVPVADSVAVYNIYRNDIIIAETDTTAYTDLWLKPGQYSYSVTAVYSNGCESENTDVLTAVVIEQADSLSVPLLEDFENGGVSPQYWFSTYPHENHPGRGNWKVDSSNTLGYTAYSGNYLAYIGVGPVKNSAEYWKYEAYDMLQSPYLNLINYKNVTISFKYLYQASVSDVSLLPAKMEISYKKNQSLFRRYSFYFERNNFDTEWQSFSYVFPDTLLSENICFGVYVDIRNGDFKDYQYISIDSLVISGTIKAEIPTGVQVSRDQGVTTVSWNSVPDATMYYIYRSDKPDVGYQEIGTSTTTSFNDPDTEFKDGVYFYKVVSEVTQKIYQAEGGNMKTGQIKDEEIVK